MISWWQKDDGVRLARIAGRRRTAFQEVTVWLEQPWKDLWGWELPWD